jgi:hypothetical protein
MFIQFVMLCIFSVQFLMLSTLAFGGDSINWAGVVFTSMSLLCIVAVGSAIADSIRA